MNNFEELLKKVKAAQTDNKFDVAIESAQSLIKNYPNKFEGYKFLAQLYAKTKRFVLAEAVLLDGCKKLQDDANIVWLLIDYTKMAEQRKDWAEALFRANQLREKYPERFESYRIAARAEKELGNLDVAETLIKAGLDNITDKENEKFLLAELSLIAKERIVHQIKKVAESSDIKVSVIIPVYNTAEYLRQCLDSIINQTLKEIEVICIDDGSTDNSLSILEEYAKKDSRVIVLKQENKGAGVARNYGMSIAKGEYLSFLDSDDFFNSNLLLETTKEADRTNSDVVVYRFQKYNNVTGEYTSAEYAFKKQFWDTQNSFDYQYNPDKIFSSFNPCTWNKLFRHSFVKENQLFFQDNKRTNDLFFTYTALVCAERIFLVDKVLAYYRIAIEDNSQSTNHLYPWDFYRALLGVKKFLEERNLLPKLDEAYKMLAKNTCIYNIKQNSKCSVLLYEELERDKFRNLGIYFTSAEVGEDFHKQYLSHRLFSSVDTSVNKRDFPKTVIKESYYDFVPKVSVVIPVYNVESFVFECLDSISNQTLKEIEIICVNDGSTDNSLAVVESYSLKDKRISIISQENRGLSEARNTGVAFAKGEFLYFIDGDDYLEENALFELYTKAHKDNLDIVYFQADSFLDKNDEMNADLEKKLATYLEYYHRKGDYESILSGIDMFRKMKTNKEYRSSACMQLLNKKFYDEKKLSFYPGILHEDNLFSLSAILQAKSTGVINKSYYKRRIRAASIMSSNTKTMKNLYGYLVTYCELMKFLDDFVFSPQVSTLIVDELNMYARAVRSIYDNSSNEEREILHQKISTYRNICLYHILNLKQIQI